MADTIGDRDTTEEVDRFAQLWRETAAEEDGLGLLPTQVAPRPLVIRAERV